MDDYRARVIPDLYTFNTMLDACIAEKKWDDFENIYRGMLHHGFHFNAKCHLRMILNASGAVKVSSLPPFILFYGIRLMLRIEYNGGNNLCLTLIS